MCIQFWTSVDRPSVMCYENSMYNFNQYYSHPTFLCDANNKTKWKLQTPRGGGGGGHLAPCREVALSL